MNLLNWFGKASDRPLSISEIGHMNVVTQPASKGTVQQTMIPVPKVKAKQQAIPSYLKTAKPTNNILPVTDRRLSSTNIEAVRNLSTTWDTIRELVAASPDLSASVFAYIRTAVTPSYTAIARNLDGTCNREATQVLQQLLTRLDVLQDYTDGFSGVPDLRSCSESLAKELIMYGAMSLELVLGKDRLPRSLVPVSVTKVKFRSDSEWLKAFQKVGGEEIDLDIPTFFYAALDQDLLQPYASSPLESAIQPVLFNAEFQNDLRRVVKKAIHPRISAVIDSDKFKKNIPLDIASDPEKLVLYMATVVSEIESKINGLNPEDALIYFDTIDMTYMTGGNISIDAEYKVLTDIIDSKMATGAKTLPSILGHGSGSQNIASSETLLFMKNVEGAIQVKLNDIYSRALTLAVRLYGLDVYVEFKYQEIDLRPKSELEAFWAMRQSRVLDLLSLGMITDEEAAITLTGKLPPDGSPVLTGTFFRAGSGSDPAATQNAYSNTSSGGNGGGLNQGITPDAPKNTKGSPAKAAKK